jgi:hypothetical protein
MGSRIPQKFSGQVAATVQALETKGACAIRALTFLNTTLAVAYLQIFNLPAGSVTLGTTVPVLSIGVPLSAALVMALPEEGWNMYGDGLSCAGTTTRTGNTGAALDINIGWGS